MDRCWEPAGLPEAIWRQIASHLSVKEYAQMAGTCKVFLELLPELPVCIDNHITDGELNFIWKRCIVEQCNLRLTEKIANRFLGTYQGWDGQHPVKHLQVQSLVVLRERLASDPATALLNSLAAQGSLQHMDTLSFSDDEEMKGNVPFLDLLASPSEGAKRTKKKRGGTAEDVPLTGNLPNPPRLPFYSSSLRHLIVKTSRMRHVMGQLPQFRALRTLSLEALGARGWLRMALDVTALTELKHLALENFSVNSIAAPQGCQLHVRWSENFKFGGDWPGGPDPEGFLFSRMWKAKNIPLASFLLHYKEGVMDLSRAGFALLDKILRREGSLNYLCLELRGLVEGEDSPLILSEDLWQGIWKAKTVRLVTEMEGLAALALGVGPEWERLSLEAVDEIDIHPQSIRGVVARMMALNMLPRLPPDMVEEEARDHMQHMRSMVEGLREFNVCGRPRTPLAVHLGDGMARSGRTCHVRPRRENYDWRTEGVFHVTSVAEDGMQSFDEVMSCGCQCCLLFLRRAGVLPREFRVAAVIESPFGTILKDEGDGDYSDDDYEDGAGEDDDDSDEDTANSDEDGEDSTGSR